MRFKCVYLEITNICNLQCSFCPGTTRSPRFLTPEEFDLLAGRLKGATEYLYFHLMGEPLLHPELDELLDRARRHGFRVNLTTNGMLLAEKATVLLSSPSLHRVNISLQAWEANPGFLPLRDYVNLCAEFVSRAAAEGILVSLRLWNAGGSDTRNADILRLLHAAFPGTWSAGQHNMTLAPRVFLESAARFDWPDPAAPAAGTSFCHGLRSHIGVLCDGTVVPCCLDADGLLSLGNLFMSPLEEILCRPRAKNIYDGFSRRQPAEALCRSCGYATRFGTGASILSE